MMTGAEVDTPAPPIVLPGASVMVAIAPGAPLT
jgi:hypothetical protein